MSQSMSWLERRASDSEVAGSIPRIGKTSFSPWEEHNFLTGILFGWEDKYKKVDMLLLVSPIVDLGNNCPMINVYDVVLRFTRNN